MAMPLRDTYDMSNIKESQDIQSFIKLKTDKKLTYLSIIKNTNFGKINYKDIFYGLQNIKEDLLKSTYSGNPYIYDIPRNQSNLKREMILEIIYFIFRNTNRTCHLTENKANPHN